MSHTQRLKLSQTAILAIVEADEGASGGDGPVAMDGTGDALAANPSTSPASSSESTEEATMSDVMATIDKALKAAEAAKALAKQPSASAIAGEPPLPQATSSEEEASLKPYANSLDYLDDQFQVLTQQLRLSQEAFKKDMESLEDNVDPWERVSRGKRVNPREFEAKLRLLSARIDSRYGRLSLLTWQWILSCDDSLSSDPDISIPRCRPF